MTAQIAYAAGQVPVLPERTSGCAGIRFLTTERSGTLVAVDGVDAARALPGVEQVTVTARPGTHVAPAVDAYGRLGHVIAVGDCAQEVETRLETAAAMTVLRVSTR